MSLFDFQEPIVFAVPDAEIILYPNFLGQEQAVDFFQKLQSEIPWQQDSITVYGKTHAQPRLTALFGNEGKPYAYSNIVMQPHPWTPLLTFLKEEIEAVCEERFTTVLLNLYRNGQNSNGNPVIASLSLGAERMFHLQHNTIKDAKLKINLTPGSLLVMKGTTQHFWKHQIPKTTKPIGPRINLTFRILK